MNRYINGAIRDLASWGAFRGKSAGEGDGTTVVDVPADMMLVTLVTIGTQEYRPIGPGYDVWYGTEQTDLVVIDTASDDRTALTATFREAVENETEVLFIGYLWPTMLNPDDPADDDEPLEADDRYQNMITAWVLAWALRATEDDYKRFMEIYEQEVARFGFRMKRVGPAQYVHSAKAYSNRCRW